MRSIEDLFFLHRTQSASYDGHESGDVAFISNNSGSNGVVGHVKPDKRDRVFDKASIVVSAMSGFSVQVPPFIARGCAGSGLVVLEPRVPLTKRQLWFTAAYLNRASSWRFNWYRQLTIDRVRRLRVPDDIPDKTPVSVQ